MSNLSSVIEREDFRSRRKAGHSAVYLSLAAFGIAVCGTIVGFCWALDYIAGLIILGLFAAMSGPSVCILVVLAVKCEDQDLDFKNVMLEMAHTFERRANISCSDYTRFLITLEDAVKVRKTLTLQGRGRILEAFKDMMIGKGRRVSGFDYVVLEKELLNARSYTDSGRNLFAKEQVRGILEDFERVGEAIRDRALTVWRSGDTYPNSNG